MDTQVKRLRELAKKCQVGVPRRSTAYEELHFVLVDCYTELHRAAVALERLDKLDREAATHVETVIVMRTHFTGEPPYVGWKGLGLALNEALDERDRALKRQQGTYESAVTGRRDFRAMYRDAKERNDRYGLALMMIREGCAEPAAFAGETLKKHAPPPESGSKEP